MRKPAHSEGQSAGLEADLDLLKIHGQVDVEAARLHAVHRDRLNCGRGCSGCCVDDLSVFEVEARRIQKHCRDVLETQRPHPRGACAFLDDRGACRIYAHRPYVCRTQGLPLRWLENGEKNELVEYRDICPLNQEGPDITGLAEHDCWTLGETEANLAQCQRRLAPGPPKRVKLRDLFPLNPQKE